MRKKAISKELVLKDARNAPRLVEIQRKVREKTIAMLVAKRKAKKMTQSDIALITGIQRPNISRLESGNYNPTIDMLVRIADSMGLKVNITFSEK
ncbi:MAG: helix-turn-helix transcriptional regulator [Butyrivibrio sp.]|nr:helix-turn-helix transcriptional regulator [Butyrivibrio sp.]